MRYRKFTGPLLAMAASYGLFALLRGTSYDVSLALPRGHFYIVSAVSLIAASVALAVGVAGLRLRNTKVVFLSLSFLSLSMLFGVHGLATPHFLIHPSRLPSVSASLALAFATFWLWMSALPADHAWVKPFSRSPGGLLYGWFAVLTVAGTVLLLRPDIAAALSLDSRPTSGVIAAILIVLLLTTIFRYYRSYLYSHFPLQLAIVYTAGLLVVSQLIMVNSEVWRVSWWLYHVYLLAAMGAAVAGLALQYGGAGSLAASIRALYTTDPVERVTSALSPSIKALMAATEKKDPYTAGHNFRVTLYALKLGEELKLPPDQLRALAQGTAVHDVGKLEVPDEVLNKPGRLSPEERRVIERHPVEGYELCRGLGFMKEELDIIRSHHERWDGGGYPDGLKGEEIPLPARIVAIADVYDALTSHRAYRQALKHEAAMELIAAQRGRQFDPACVDAWVRLCERHPERFPLPAEWDAAAAAPLRRASTA